MNVANLNKPLLCSMPLWKKLLFRPLSTVSCYSHNCVFVNPVHMDRSFFHKTYIYFLILTVIYSSVKRSILWSFICIFTTC